MKTQSRTRSLVMPALAAALLAILSPWTIPVGPIPLTLAVFAVFLTGAMLRPVQAAASLAVYLLLGLFGLPIFSGFRGGPQVLLGPTGGYLVGYFILALGVSLAACRTRRFGLRLAAGAGALCVFYPLGTLWYSAVTGTGFAAGLLVCVVPFVLPDTLKLLAALALAKALEKRRVS
jgi:biotin transport system substrate-specific component